MKKVNMTVFTFEINEILPVNNGLRVLLKSGTWYFTDKVQVDTMQLSFQVDELVASENNNIE